jgi:hypothetical protein
MALLGVEAWCQTHSHVVKYLKSKFLTPYLRSHTQTYKIIISPLHRNFFNMKSQYPPIDAIGGYWLFRSGKFPIIIEIMIL